MMNKNKTPKQNNVFGILGVQAKMSSFNNDFTNNPKRHLGTYYSSAGALKYAYRNALKLRKDLVHPVFVTKSMRIDEKGNFKPRTIEERFIHLFGPLQGMSQMDYVQKVMSCEDVEMFGMASTVSNYKQDITGAIQFTKGINLYDETRTIRDETSSAYKNSNERSVNNDQNTLGSTSFVDEAHYAYDFSIIPANYHLYKEALGDSFIGFSEETYELFKELSLYAVNTLSSFQRKGCQMDYALFVQMKDESNAYLSNLHTLATYSKEEEGDVLNISKIMQRLEGIKDEIKSIELYYLQDECRVELGDTEVEVKLFDLTVPYQQRVEAELI